MGEHEVGGFIVHFFYRAKVDAVSSGSVEDFEEGGLPRKLFLVSLKKPK
jgi:hypothetical protein